MSAVSDLSYELPRQRAPDAAALACSLFTRHQRRIYRLCLIRLGSRQDAEDALQQTFVNALKALQAGVRPHAEAAWLLEIARNALSSNVSFTSSSSNSFAYCLVSAFFGSRRIFTSASSSSASSATATGRRPTSSGIKP